MAGKLQPCGGGRKPLRRLPATLRTTAVWRRAAGVCLIGVVVGVLANAVRPVGALPWRYRWDEHLAGRALAAGLAVWDVDRVFAAAATGELLLLDARPAEAYWAGALPGAVHLPFGQRLDRFPEVQPLIFDEWPVVIYCSGPDCDEALQLALFLQEQGHTNLAVFIGGVAAWQAAGHPLEGAP